jgi:uracil-DNA glycosylase
MRPLPHVAPISALARQIGRETGRPVPEADPADGGVHARMLLVLETPGPSHALTGRVSRDNPTPTAANLRRFLSEAAIAREDTLIWNAVPFVIHLPGARNRAPRRGEIRDGLLFLPRLLALLPRLHVAVLAGRVAAEAAPVLHAACPGLPVLHMPHPSPTYVCTSPDIPRRIAATLAEAKALLAPMRSVAA